MLDDGRELTADDFFTAGTEDRYPDVFGLIPAESDHIRSQRDELAQYLSTLPRYGITLGHNVDANTRLLTALTGR
ncbi:hypothetical protein ACFYT4_31635 [Streptomyces sp. NPDC004609]|uniref:hypothetical protein n=1 Tax=Streptomyces sp. NPDC004609 TaxID=3364704 RepID=UPI0036951E71